MAIKIRLRGDTAANWTAADPVLDEREFAVETDTGKAKLGDGATAWTSLAYWTVDAGEWLTGSGVPNDANGNDGDMYLDTDTGDVYQKAAGTWGAAILNIVGADGANGADGAAAPEDINQAAHGFAVGDPVRHDGTSYVKATADTSANAVIVGIVTAVADVDNFTLQVIGKVTTLAGLTGGTIYYLQDAGGIGATAGTVEKAVLLATSATEGYLLAVATGSGSGGGGASTFVALSDTPAAYTGHAGKLLAVTAGEDGIEFVAGAPPTITSKSADYTLVEADNGDIIEVDATSAAVTISLPDGLSDGFQAMIVKTDASANAVTLAASGTATLVGKGTDLTAQHDVATVYRKTGDVYRAVGDLA